MKLSRQAEAVTTSPILTIAAEINEKIAQGDVHEKLERAFIDEIELLTNRFRDYIDKGIYPEKLWL